MLKAEYSQRGPVPEEVIAAVPLELDQPRGSEALLEVLAAPINPSDVLTLTGEYATLPPLPAIGGNEGVGRVTEVGAEVTNVDPGDIVLLPPGSGTWRTHMLATGSNLIRLPSGADPLQLAMMTVNPPTASLMLSSYTELGPGDWVAQNAANSGVGSYLIQLARSRGLKTVNVVRRESAIEGVLSRGGDVCLVDGPELRERVKQATGGRLARLGIDAVAGEATGRLASTLERGATLVNYGAMSGEACVVPSHSLIFSGQRIEGFWLTQWFRDAPASEQARLFSEISQLVASGSISAPVAATFGIEEIQEAVALAAAGGRNGKVLITPNH